MRENWARLIVFITGILVVLLSMLFAMIQNPEKRLVEETRPVSKGELIYQQQGCARCHFLNGEGGLAGVATKHSDEELRDWITGRETLEGKMSQSMMKVKSKYQQLTEEQLDALVEYLKSQ